MRRARRVTCAVAAATVTLAVSSSAAISRSTEQPRPVPVHTAALVADQRTADQRTQVTRTRAQLVAYGQRIRQLRTEIATAEQAIRRAHR